MAKGNKQAGDYEVEYAKSNRSTCKITQEKIPKGDLRIGVIAKARNFDGLQTSWYSWDAFKDDKKRMAAFQKNCKKLWGVEALRPADQQELNGLLRGSSSQSSSSQSTSSDAGSEEVKDPKYEESVKETEQLWEIKDKLKKEKTKVLRDMLEVNNQNSRGGESDLLDKCAFGMLFGALPKCGNEECENGQLYYSDGMYKCAGKTTWGRCPFSASVDEVELDDWEIPDSAQTKFLENFEFKKQKKCDYVPKRDVNETVEPEVAEQQAEELRKENESKPLGNYVIAFAGTLSMKQADIKKIVSENGGRVVTAISEKVTYVISTAKEYAKDSKKIKEAKENDVPIMEEDFIHQSVEQEKKLDAEERKPFVLFEPERAKRKLDALEATEEVEPPRKRAKKVQIKGRAAVDSECEIADKVHVYDEGGDIYGVWNVSLAQVDIQRNINKYYVLQLLEHDDKNKRKYYLFRRWGRLGTDIGDTKLEKLSLSKAKKQFEKLYAEKTGNDWETRNDFEKVPGKMYPVETDYSTEEKPSLMSAEDLSKDYTGALDKRVQDFIRLIFDVKQFDQTLKQMEIDTHKMPLGKLSKKHLNEGFKVLNKVQQLLDKISKEEEEQGSVTSSSTAPEVKEEEAETKVISRKNVVRRRRARKTEGDQSQSESQTESQPESQDKTEETPAEPTKEEPVKEEPAKEEPVKEETSDETKQEVKQEPESSEEVKSEKAEEKAPVKSEEQTEDNSKMDESEDTPAASTLTSSVEETTVKSEDADVEMAEKQSTSSQSGSQQEVPKAPSAIHKKYRSHFLELSNQFYTFVPHIFTSKERIKPIDNLAILKEKIEMVESLLEMEVATTLLKSKDDKESPIDTYYKSLNTKLEALNRDQEEYKMMETYLQNTHAQTHRSYSLDVMDIFKVDRQGEAEKFSKWKEDKNKMLLWHGSRLTNWVGILSQGLRIAPPEAPVTGYMFGKGVYFADMSSKSANYCFTSEENNVGILILSEVALGDMYTRLGAEYVTPEQLESLHKHSTWGQGKTMPDPKQAQLIPSCLPDSDIKVTVPLGKPSNAPVPRHSSLLYNEFIVYDISQIKIRYLLKVKFNYK